MLWTLLVSIVFFIAVIGALDSTKQTTAGVSGYALGIVVGSLIGTSCALAVRKLGEIVGARASHLQSESGRRWCFRALYFSTIFWIFLAAILGKWVASAVLRFAF